MDWNKIVASKMLYSEGGKKFMGVVVQGLIELLQYNFMFLNPHNISFVEANLLTECNQTKFIGLRLKWKLAGIWYTCMFRAVNTFCSLISHFSTSVVNLLPTYLIFSSTSARNKEAFGIVAEAINNDYGGAERCPWSPAQLRGKLLLQ